MTVAVHPTALEGVLVIEPSIRRDERGFFLESYHQSAYQSAGIRHLFVQDNCSLSAEPGTIRGLHYQLPPETQAKLVRVERGAIFDAFVDLRRERLRIDCRFKTGDVALDCIDDVLRSYSRRGARFACWPR